MKLLLSISLITLSLTLNAQKILKSDFKNTLWFSNNENKTFYNSDTINLVKIVKFNSYNDSINALNINLNYNNHKDLTELNFYKTGKLKVEDLNVDSWTNTKLVGRWKWKFDAKNQTLKLYFKNKLKSSFKILSKDTDTIIWKFEHNNIKTESKLNLLVLNLLREK